MLKIDFYPDCDIPRFIEAAGEYQKIWQEDGNKICNAIEKITGLSFQVDLINAIVLEKKSESHPLTLRASYSKETKKATLIHELCHRIIPRTTSMKDSSLENHKVLDLVLYDIWLEIYGKEFADQSVTEEGNMFGSTYKEAWESALVYNKDERQAEFKKMVGRL